MVSCCSVYVLPRILSYALPTILSVVGGYIHIHAIVSREPVMQNWSLLGFCHMYVLMILASTHSPAPYPQGENHYHQPPQSCCHTAGNPGTLSRHRSCMRARLLWWFRVIMQLQAGPWRLRCTTGQNWMLWRGFRCVISLVGSAAGCAPCTGFVGFASCQPQRLQI